MMNQAIAGPFQLYLDSKRSVDDRALNRAVYAALADHSALDRRPLRILEIGCGTGMMLDRLLRWGTLEPLAGVEYTGIDSSAESIEHARRAVEIPSALDATFVAADLYSPVGSAPFDLLIAHAVLDLLHLPTAMKLISERLRPGGLAWLTLNFDGVTLLEPVPDPTAEERILSAYHASMDQRTTNGLRSGDSRTGRRLFAAIRQAGLSLLATGASDWVVNAVHGPQGADYPAQEAEFLRHIVDTIVAEPAVAAAVSPAALAAWRAQRVSQIEDKTLVYIAHQLDFLVQTPAPLEGSWP